MTKKELKDEFYKRIQETEKLIEEKQKQVDKLETIINLLLDKLKLKLKEEDYIEEIVDTSKICYIGLLSNNIPKKKVVKQRLILVKK